MTSSSVRADPEVPRQCDPGLIVCICTYQRAEVLSLLLGDLAKQSLIPKTLLIVDGDPNSPDVARLVKEVAERFQKIFYVASNHANLAFQRYLGWKVANSLGAEFLLYLDDDLRLLLPDSIEMVLKPLQNPSERVVGCTAETHAEPEKVTAESAMLAERSAGINAQAPFLVSLLGSSRGVPHGGLTPTGSRIAPLRTGGAYAKVDWLQGRVMAYRMDALVAECFPNDLFALCEIKCGLGEDTVISHRVRSKGDMYFLFGDYFYHPSTLLPNSYPTRSRALGFTTAYSRRLLNDNYRWPADPRFSDRLALWKSFAGTTLLNVFRALRSPKAHRFAYAWGYLLGAVKGVFQPPTHSRLTPHIDWQRDAEIALSQRVDLTIKS